MGIPPSGRGAMSGPAAAGQGGDYGSRTPRRTLLLPPPRGPPAARLRRGPPATALPGTLACDGGEAGAASGFRSWWGPPFFDRDRRHKSISGRDALFRATLYKACN